MGGYFPVNNSINFITFATTGNSQDFGDLIDYTVDYFNGGANPTRGYFAGGNTPSKVNNIQFVTIMTSTKEMKDDENQANSQRRMEGK